MERSRYHRLRELFVEVTSAAPDQRPARLDAIAADDPSLRDELEDLLRIDDARSPALRPETASERSRLALLERLDGVDGGLLEPPARIGRYRVLRPIGRGGMGCVYEAEQDAPRRTVALKVVHPALATPLLLRRFEFEAAVLARLHHPGIARIYEAGTAGRGAQRRPWFAMELVDGVPITTYAERAGLEPRARLELVARVCDAVHHAHQKGVVHRDLKPSNILVEPDGDGGPGLPKVLDFGVARATDVDVRGTTLRTDLGQLVGTIPYMSPEQAVGDSTGIDTRSDVYALGVLAYRLLAGRLPCDLDARPAPDALRAIRDEEAARLGTIDRALRGDVETIVAKALAKDPQRRYDSAAALAADIRRHLADEPIEARPPSAVYQFRKFARRHRPLLAAVTAAVVVLLVGAAGTTGGMLWALDESNRAGEALTLAANRLAALEAAREEAQCQAELAEERLVEAEEGYRDAETVLGFMDSVLAAGAAWHENQPQTVRELVTEMSESIRSNDHGMPELVRARILQATGNSLARVGLMTAAANDLNDSLSTYEQYLDPCDTRIVETKRLLCMLAAQAGDSVEFERLYTSLAPCINQLPLSDSFTLELARIREITRRRSYPLALQEVESLHRSCIDAFGTDDWRTALVLGSLGGAEFNAANYEQSIAYCASALGQLETSLGSGSEAHLSALHTLGRALLAIDEPTGEAFLWDALRHAGATVGLTAPCAMDVRTDLAICVYQRDKVLGRQLLEDLLLDREIAQGVSHPSTVWVAETLARLANE